jgi:hypothetical protein
MDTNRYIFLLLAFILMLGCEKKSNPVNEDFPEYFKENIQETYLNDLKDLDVQEYKEGSISCTVNLTTEYHVEVLFKNELEIPIPVGKSLLLIDTLSGKKNTFMWTPFRIFRDGEPVQYIGKIANVRNLEHSNIVIMPPQETYTANINLEDYYDLSGLGNYTLKYKAFNSSCFSVIGKNGLLKIESNTIEFEKK